MPSYKEQFNLSIFDYSPVGYCVLELVLDDKGQPVDWIYRYCNQAFADIKDHSLEEILDHSFQSLFPEADNKWLHVCYEAAYENRSSETDVRKEKNYHVVIAPVGKTGFCSGMIYESEKAENKNTEINDPMPDENYIVKKLFPEYVSLYRIELNSGKYEILRLVSNTNAKKLADKTSGIFNSFDEYSKVYADTFISEKDKAEFLDWHLCRNMKKRLRYTEKITYHYQSISEDGHNSYYEAYATKGKVDDETFTIFLGYRNVGSILYKEKAIQQKLAEALEKNKAE